MLTAGTVRFGLLASSLLVPFAFSSTCCTYFGPLLQAFEASVPLGQLMCLVVP